MATLEPRKVPERWLKTPRCGICGHEMIRLQNGTENFYIPVFACGKGEPGKAPCDGVAVRFGT